MPQLRWLIPHDKRLSKTEQPHHQLVVLLQATPLKSLVSPEAEQVLRLNK